MSSYQSLRDRQVGWSPTTALVTVDTDAFAAAIKRVLNLNQAAEEDHDVHHDSGSGLVTHSAPILNADGEPIWKVLVFDNLGRDVISSVLRVNDLRGWGITIHL